MVANFLFQLYFVETIETFFFYPISTVLCYTYCVTRKSPVTFACQDVGCVKCLTSYFLMFRVLMPNCANRHRQWHGSGTRPLCHYSPISQNDDLFASLISGFCVSCRIEAVEIIAQTHSFIVFVALFDWDWIKTMFHFKKETWYVEFNEILFHKITVKLGVKGQHASGILFSEWGK